jgi:hypothetical protein
MNANRPPNEGRAEAVKNIGSDGDRANVIRFPSDRVMRHASLPDPYYLGWFHRAGAANRAARANPTSTNLEALEAIAMEGQQWS